MITGETALQLLMPNHLSFAQVIAWLEVVTPDPLARQRALADFSQCLVESVNSLNQMLFGRTWEEAQFERLDNLRVTRGEVSRLPYYLENLKPISHKPCTDKRPQWRELAELDGRVAPEKSLDQEIESIRQACDALCSRSSTAVNKARDMVVQHQRIAAKHRLLMQVSLENVSAVVRTEYSMPSLLN